MTWCQILFFDIKKASSQNIQEQLRFTINISDIKGFEESYKEWLLTSLDKFRLTKIMSPQTFG